MPHNGSYTSAYFFWILIPIRMKFGQMLACSMANITSMFLVQCWRLKTSPRPFYDFGKITRYRDQTILNNWCLPFLIAPYSPFQKNETLESWHDLLFNNCSRLLNWKGPENYPQVLQIVQKVSEKYCPCLHLSIDQVWWISDLWFKICIQKCTLSHELMLIMMSQIC